MNKRGVFVLRHSKITATDVSVSFLIRRIINRDSPITIPNNTYDFD
ncbi:hypothetical protein ACDX66_26990 [Peribacillus frigoritolerans]